MVERVLSGWPFGVYTFSYFPKRYEGKLCSVLTIDEAFLAEDSVFNVHGYLKRSGAKLDCKNFFVYHIYLILSLPDVEEDIAVAPDSSISIEPRSSEYKAKDDSRIEVSKRRGSRSAYQHRMQAELIPDTR